MRIKTDGDYQHRSELYGETATRFDRNTKSQGIDVACEFARQMEAALERAVNHPDMTAELAEILSTPHMPVEYEVVTGVGFDDE